MMSEVQNCLFGTALCIGFGVFLLITGEILASIGWGSGVIWSLIASNYAFNAEN